MKNKNISPIIILLLFIFTTSCDRNRPIEPSPQINAGGVFVINEGAFMSGSGEVSYINLSNGTVTNNLFQSINGFPAGNLAQSMTILNNKGYLLLNGSQKIEVVDLPGFSNTATITGFSSPRYMVASGNKAYVSDWISNDIKVVDLNTNQVISSIATGKGPEQLLISNNKLFVVNCGGYDTDSTISIIDLNSGLVNYTITAGINPNSLKIDNNGKLWVLCSGSTGPDYIGGTPDDIGGSLWKIDPVTLITEAQFQMGQYNHPVKLQTNHNGTNLYWLQGIDGYNGSIYTMSSDALQLPSAPFSTKSFYGLGVNPNSGDVFGSAAPSFTQNGYVIRFDSTAVMHDSLTVGIGPSSFVFN